jgi:hypothetical protein
VTILVALHHGLNRLTCLPGVDLTTFAGDAFQSQVGFERVIYGETVAWETAG